MTENDDLVEKKRQFEEGFQEGMKIMQEYGAQIFAAVYRSLGASMYFSPEEIERMKKESEDMQKLDENPTLNDEKDTN